MIEADHVCHELLRSDKDVYAGLVSAFGTSILGADKLVDRRVLGEIVFNDQAELEKLNKILHPPARAGINRFFAEQPVDTGSRGKVAVVPLVYEAGWEDDWDLIVCVAAPRSVQTARMLQRGFSHEQVAARIAAQMPVEQKMEMSDFVVFNSGSRELLETQVGKVFGLI